MICLPEAPEASWRNKPTWKLPEKKLEIMYVRRWLIFSSLIMHYLTHITIHPLLIIKYWFFDLPFPICRLTTLLVAITAAWKSFVCESWLDGHTQVQPPLLFAVSHFGKCAIFSSFLIDPVTFKFVEVRFWFMTCDIWSSGWKYILLSDVIL